MNKENKNIAAQVQRSLTRRYFYEHCFKWFGLASLLLALLFLVILIGGVASRGYKGFFQTYIKLDIVYDWEVMSITDVHDPEQLNLADYDALVKQSVQALFPVVESRTERRKLFKLVSSGAIYKLQQYLREHPGSLDKTVPLWLMVDDDVDTFLKQSAHDQLKYRKQPESERRLSDWQLFRLDELVAGKRLEIRINRDFFTTGDSREPEQAGIGGALMGSLLTLLMTLLLSFPIGVATAVYLEEFAPRNRWTDFVEVNINNLAAVPSVVFGLLGLAIFINTMALPRSAPLVGGLVLALMTLPTIIIASRVSIKAVPPSIRQAALGIGASKMQTVLHHVIPLAMPGMLTGTIIGMARALGETAPLLMIGMVAFIADVPGKITDPSSVLPVQIYLWADTPERAFVEKTSAAILVLLVFLALMNGLAVYMRKKFERKW